MNRDVGTIKTNINKAIVACLVTTAFSRGSIDALSKDLGKDLVVYSEVPGGRCTACRRPSDNTGFRDRSELTCMPRALTAHQRRSHSVRSQFVGLLNFKHVSLRKVRLCSEHRITNLQLGEVIWAHHFATLFGRDTMRLHPVKPMLKRHEHPAGSPKDTTMPLCGLTAEKSLPAKPPHQRQS